ncbi:MAG TPA: methyltransferase domain-containing protein [Candidatus Binatia bacterium]|nr:methyltransferase domain-containing protein [Candidatus Binatia bacterium]
MSAAVERPGERPQDVATHFDRSAEWFDSVYTGSGVSPLRRLATRIFMYDIFWRFDLTLRECDPIAGAAVLDIGCGTAVYPEALGRRGAARLVGLDFAPTMIAIARQRMEAAGLAARTELLCTDYLAYPETERFDYTLAIGVFDYFRDPGPYLAKMARMTTRKAIATFPQLWNPWTAVRRLRYTLTGINCPLHFFGRGRVRRLMQDAGFRTVRVRTLTNIFFAVGEP